MLAGASDEAKQLGADASQLRKETKKSRAEALSQVIAFHRYLCGLTVLDPACGTANFLYVTMEHMKRLEAEVLELIAALGGDAGMEMQGFRVRPEHFIGLELNKQAVAIAQLVLWIGYFQWQHKTTGKADTGDRPLLPKDRSIFEQDAVLAYDERVPRRDPDSGDILTVWDGHSTKPHPITGKDVPDESARTTLFDYINPRRAEWPQADYIVGNPPFIGNKRMREALGDGYVDALRKAWKGDVPESSDFVMFWWRKAAELASDGKAKRFGFITTNSINQTFNRRVLEPFLGDSKKPLHLSYTIPDHPWIDSIDGAAVRIAMTVAAPGHEEGVLEEVKTEHAHEDGENEVVLVSKIGFIALNLSVGANVSNTTPLKSNQGLCGQGIKVVGDGFYIDPVDSELAWTKGPCISQHVNATDILTGNQGRPIIDFFGLSQEEALQKNPEAFNQALARVYPIRQHNKRPSIRDLWWRFAWERPVIRKATADLSHYFVTLSTSKHRFFTSVPSSTVWDGALFAIAVDDFIFHGVLSSFIHKVWALEAGGTLEDRPTWTNKTCFDPFPFPALEESPLKQRIRDLGERLDAHRKRQQEQHPDLTLTGIYNVLQKIRSVEALNAKDKAVHDQGLISVLKQIHDDLDAAVLEAYGWTDLASATPPADILARGGPDAEALEQAILTRLVALNHARAAEEKRGHVRWLRPDFQAPASSDGHRPTLQSEIGLSEDDTTPDTAAPVALLDWPPELPAQVAALRKLLPTVGPDPEALAACFGRKNKKRQDQITSILETLRSLGHIL